MPPWRRQRPLCLASASPRRRELLERLGLQFAVQASDVDETPLPSETAPAHALRLAEAKARVARDAFPGHGILSGDTVVVLDAHLLGKPTDPDDAERMLTLLSGRTHQVLSAWCLLDADTGECGTGLVETAVTFRRLPPAWIRWYSRLDEARDKAGAYGIQGIGGTMVERIEGSYPNVVGFPVDVVLWELLARDWLAL